MLFDDVGATLNSRNNLNSPGPHSKVGIHVFQFRDIEIAEERQSYSSSEREETFRGISVERPMLRACQQQPMVEHYRFVIGMGNQRT